MHLLAFLLTSYTFAIAPKGPHNNGPRVQALTLLSKGFKPDEIKADTGLSKSTIYDLQKRALSHGYDPSKDQKILIAYMEDAPKVGRPKKCTPEVEEAVIKTISKNSTTRELSTQKIADIVSPLAKGGILARFIHQILRR